MEVATTEDCKAGFLTSSSSGSLSWRDSLRVRRSPPSLLAAPSRSLCLAGGPPPLSENPRLSNKLPRPLPPPGPERASNLAWMGLQDNLPISTKIMRTHLMAPNTFTGAVHHKEKITRKVRNRRIESTCLKMEVLFNFLAFFKINITEIVFTSTLSIDKLRSGPHFSNP